MDDGLNSPHGISNGQISQNHSTLSTIPHAQQYMKFFQNIPVNIDRVHLWIAILQNAVSFPDHSSEYLRRILYAFEDDQLQSHTGRKPAVYSRWNGVRLEICQRVWDGSSG